MMMVMAATPATAASLKPVIGFEVHAQLKTATKLFCGCGTEFAAAPNSLTCPVCLGLPGSLPVMNRRAVEMAVKLALALECEINFESYQARKNYFYPDLPKGYQISQYKVPVAHDGTVHYWYRDELRSARIKRVQIEEDTAKMFHQGEQSLIDYNRSGVPLVEIVTEPDFTSAEEGVAYLKELRNLVRTLGVCDGNMEEGSLRCEPNVSLATGDPSKDRWKVELKNLGSFRAVERAIKFELDRQRRVLDSGGRVPQETRGFNEQTDETFPMRSKEFEEDYRYFADPDLPLLKLDEEWTMEIKRRLPTLPWFRRWDYMGRYQLTPDESEVISSEPQITEFFENAMKETPRLLRENPAMDSGAVMTNANRVASWMSNDLLSIANQLGGWDKLELSPVALVDLVMLVRKIVITGKSAKEILEHMAREGGTPDEWMARLGLARISDDAEIEKAVDAVLASPEAASMIVSFKKGKETVLTALMGLVMKHTRGKADPKTVERLLREKLKERP